MVITKSQAWRQQFRRDKQVSTETLEEIILDILGENTVYISQEDVWRSINWELGFTRRDEDDFPVSTRQVRLCIEGMRYKGELIISSGGVGGGYKMAQSLQEVSEFVGRMYTVIAKGMLKKGSMMMASARAKHGGQTFWDYETDQALDEIQAELELL